MTVKGLFFFPAKKEDYCLYVFPYLCQNEPYLRHNGVLGYSSDLCIQPLKLSAGSGVLSEAKHRKMC